MADGVGAGMRMGTAVVGGNPTIMEGAGGREPCAGGGTATSPCG